MFCPKCGHDSVTGDECPKCGVFISKYLLALEKKNTQNAGEKIKALWDEAYKLHYNAGDVDKALELYKQIIELYPDSPEAGSARQQIKTINKETDDEIVPRAEEPPPKQPSHPAALANNPKLKTSSKSSSHKKGFSRTTIIPFAIICALIIMGVGLYIYSNSPTAARKKLESMSIEYNASSFVDCADKGNIDAVNLFIKAGIDLNSKNADGATALMVATDKGHADVVQVLLNNGADVKATDENDETVLMHAVHAGDMDIFQVLINKGADAKATDKDGRTVLMYAAMGGSPVIIKVLIDKGNLNVKDNFGFSALMYAVFHSNNDAVAELIDKGADVNSVADGSNKMGSTFPLMIAVFKQNTVIISLLIDKGANINLTDNEGNTALINASKDGYIDVVQTLISKGADVNRKNNDGDSAYSISALMWSGYASGLDFWGTDSTTEHINTMRNGIPWRDIMQALDAAGAMHQ